MTSVPLGSEMLDFSRAVVRRYVLVLFLLDSIPETRVSMRSERTSFGQACDRNTVGINPTKSSDQLDSQFMKFHPRAPNHGGEFQ